MTIRSALLGLITSTLPALAQPGATNWMFATGDAIYTSPAIGPDGTIYIASYDYKVYAVRPDGTKRWEFDVQGRPPRFPQMWSSPAVGSDGAIYFGTGDRYVYALNTNGTLRWKFETGNQVWSDVAIGPDQAVYVAGFDTNFYALYPTNTVRWVFPAGDQMFADPVFGPNGVIYFGADDGKLYAIGATGTKLWDFQGGGGTVASPAIGDDGTVYFASTHGVGGRTLYAVHPDGSMKWAYRTGGQIESSPAIGPDGAIYIGSNDRRLHAVHLETGTNLWSLLTGGAVKSSPAVAADGTIYVGSDDGRLYAVDSMGNPVWSAPTGGAVYSSPAIGPDGTVYVGSAGGRLYAFQGTAPLAGTAWPMFRGNPQRTGRTPHEPDNYPPYIDPIDDVTVNSGQLVSLSVNALDPDDAGAPLIFELDPGAPETAQIDPSTGAFSWLAEVSGGATTNEITIRVIDQGSPAATSTQSFSIVVNPGMRITSIGSADGMIRITWTTTPNTNYRVWGSASLGADSQWTDLSGTIQSGGIGAEWIGPIEGSSRFYRIEQVP